MRAMSVSFRIIHPVLTESLGHRMIGFQAGDLGILQLKF